MNASLTKNIFKMISELWYIEYSDKYNDYHGEDANPLIRKNQGLEDA